MTTAGAVRANGHAKWARTVALLIAMCSVGLVVHTYATFDQMWDEGPHIGPGMEWLVKHTYKMDRMNSPLPRGFIALGPYLQGARPHGFRDPGTEGSAILQSGNYERLLYSARLGTLVFFIFGLYLMWSRGRLWLGEWGGSLALGLFATCEPVMGHAGVAATDVSVMVMFFWGLDRLWRLAGKPTLRNSLLAGFAVGVALVCKHTAAPFFVVTIGLLGIAYWVVRARGSLGMVWRHPVLRVKAWGPVVVVAFLVVWATYFFTVGPLFPAGSPDEGKVTAFLARHHVPRGPVFAVLNHVPAPDYLGGIRDARANNHNPKPSYFMGRISMMGRRSFYVVALLVKTPIPFLIFAMAGLGLAVWGMLRRERGYAALMLIGLAGPLLFVSMNHLNMGLRHGLAVYPFLAILGAMAGMRMWRRGTVLPVLVITLLVWQCVAAVAASPDYLAYFNEAAAKHADYFLVDSDLDWGQDAKRLPGVLSVLGATDVAIAYNGTDDLRRFALPKWHEMTATDRTGWIVVSERFLKLYPEKYGWLEAYKPVGMVGKSMRVYHLQ